MEEIWKPVVGFEEYYEVSNLGKVRSLDRLVIDTMGRKRKWKGSILKQKVNPRGYLVIDFCKSGKNKTVSVHRVIARSFLRDFDENKTIDHIDRVRTNNHISNLRMATHSENIANTRGFNYLRNGLKGTTKRGRRWCASIRKGKNIHIGMYDTEKEAHEAYNKKAKELFGEFAYDNKLLE
jgi:hypothetical protein